MWNFSKFASLFYQVFFLSLAAAATHVYGLVDQAFISQLSSGHLRTHIYIDYIVLLFILAARVVGQSLLVAVSKAQQTIERGQYLSGALGLTIGFSLLLYSGMGVLSQFRLVDLGLVDSTRYSHIQIFAAILLSTNVILKFALIAEGKHKALLAGEALGNTLNLILNYVFFIAFESNEDKFVGIAYSTLLSQLCLGVYYGLLNRQLLHLKALQPIVFLKRGRVILGGEAFNMILLAYAPLLITGIMELRADLDLLVGFNVGFRLYSLLSIPLVAMTMIGTTHLSKLAIKTTEENGKVADQWRSYKLMLGLTGAILTLVPGAILFLFNHDFFTYVISLESDASRKIALFQILNVVYGFWSGVQGATLRALEKPYYIGAAGLMSSYFVTSPALYVYFGISQCLIGTGLILVGPGLVGVLFLQFVIKSIEKKKVLR